MGNSNSQQLSNLHMREFKDGLYASPSMSNMAEMTKRVSMNKSKRRTPSIIRGDTADEVRERWMQNNPGLAQRKISRLSGGGKRKRSGQRSKRKRRSTRKM